METVLLADHGTVVFHILTSALALLFSNEHQTRSEIEHHFRKSGDTGWNSLTEQFQALVRERSDN